MRRCPEQDGVETCPSRDYSKPTAPQAVSRASKFLSLILRHRPEVIGIKLDSEGWADIDEIVRLSNGKLTRPLIDQAVADNSKQRFGISENGKRIRARQGHSLDVNLGLIPVEPPETLYHGTYPGALEAIRREGLRKMNRQHVHMAADVGTASSVGMRRGAPVVLRIQAGKMHRQGFLFYQSENGVWLTDSVPPDFIEE